MIQIEEPLKVPPGTFSFWKVPQRTFRFKKVPGGTFKRVPPATQMKRFLQELLVFRV